MQITKHACNNVAKKTIVNFLSLKYSASIPTQTTTAHEINETGEVFWNYGRVFFIKIHCQSIIFTCTSHHIPPSLFLLMISFLHGNIIPADKTRVFLFYPHCLISHKRKMSCCSCSLATGVFWEFFMVKLVIPNLTNGNAQKDTLIL